MSDAQQRWELAAKQVKESADSRTSWASQLPTYEVVGIYSTLVGDFVREVKVAEVLCPRSDCKRIFVVAIKDYWHKSNHRAGSCPFCQRTAWRGKRPK